MNNPMTNIPTSEQFWMQNYDGKDSIGREIMRKNTFVSIYNSLTSAYEAIVKELDGTEGGNEYRPWEVQGITQIAWWKKLHLEDSARIYELESQLSAEKQKREKMVERIKNCKSGSGMFCERRTESLTLTTADCYLKSDIDQAIKEE